MKKFGLDMEQVNEVNEEIKELLDSEIDSILDELDDEWTNSLFTEDMHERLLEVVGTLSQYVENDVDEFISLSDMEVYMILESNEKKLYVVGCDGTNVYGFEGNHKERGIKTITVNDAKKEYPNTKKVKAGTTLDTVYRQERREIIAEFHEKQKAGLIEVEFPEYICAIPDDIDDEELNRQAYWVLRGLKSELQKSFFDCLGDDNWEEKLKEKVDYAMEELLLIVDGEC